MSFGSLLVLCCMQQIRALMSLLLCMFATCGQLDMNRRLLKAIHQIEKQCTDLLFLQGLDISLFACQTSIGRMALRQGWQLHAA